MKGGGGLNREGWFNREGRALIKLFHLPKIMVSILHNELEAVEVGDHASPNFQHVNKSYWIIPHRTVSFTWAEPNPLILIM